MVGDVATAPGAVPSTRQRRGPVGEVEVSEETTGPSPAPAPDRLTPTERRQVLRAAGVTAGLVGIAVVPATLLVGAGVAEAVGAVVLYGGLLALVAAFVSVARLQARQCPACARRHEEATDDCPCGYDLVTRPRFACARRHQTYLGPGECDCGGQLQRLPTARGLASQAGVALRISGGLLLFLTVIAVAAYLLEGRI